MRWFRCNALVQGPVGSFVSPQCIRLDQVESTRARGDGMRVNMKSGDTFILDADEARRLEAAMKYFNAGYGSVMGN